MSRLIPLHGKHGSGLSALVDDGAYEVISMVDWKLSNWGYVVRGNLGGGRVIRLHRVIAGARAGEIVDHINGNKLDNRSENLRICTKSVNAINPNNKRKASRSPYRGVYQRRKRWVAMSHIGGKPKYLGTYDTPELAYSAYRASIDPHLNTPKG